MGPSTIHVLHLASASGAAARHARRILATCRGLEDHGGAREFRGSMAIIRRRGETTDLGEDALRAGVECYSVRRYGFFDPTIGFRLAGVIKRLAIDIVHTYDRQSRFWALLLQPRFRFRMVAKAFEPETHNWSEKIALEIDHKLLPGFDRVIAANAQLARQLCRLGCRIGQIDVIPDEQIEEAAPTAPQRLRAQLVIPERAPVVGLYLDGLNEAGALRMAEAVRYAQGRLGPLYTLGIGPDIGRAEIRKALLSTGLAPRLRMFDIADQLDGVSSSVDALIFAGSGAGPATLGAQTVGVPIVATASTGASEISQSQWNALTITEDSAVAVGAALVQALGRKRQMVAKTTVVSQMRHDYAADAETMERLVHSYRRAMMV